MKWFKSVYIIFVLLLALPFYGEQTVSGQAKAFPKTVSKIAAPGKKKNSSRLNQAERLVQFIGTPTRSLSFGNVDAGVLSNYAGSAATARSEDEPTTADSGIAIIIDTNQVIGVEETGFNNRTASTAQYDAYPVIIKNISGKKLIVVPGKGAGLCGGVG